jgi:hypothetical protein
VVVQVVVVVVVVTDSPREYACGETYSIDWLR